MAKQSKKQDILYSNGNLFFLGGMKPPTEMQGGIGSIAGSIGGMIPTNTKAGGAASGALKGASMGMALGPWGALAGGVIGGTAGLISADKAQDEAREQAFNSSMQERNGLLGIKANGGFISPLGTNQNQSTMYNQGGMLNEFNTGGSHQSNPNSGVQQGIATDGTPNLVEEGETKHQDYIFSDRLLIDKNTAAEHNFPKSMIGKTFAEASKKMNKLHKERPNDPITRDTVKSNLNHLMMANDAVREYEQGSMMASGGKLYSDGGQNLEDPNRLDEFLYPSPQTQMKSLGISEYTPTDVQGFRIKTPSYAPLQSDKLNSKIQGIADQKLNAKTRLGSELPGFFKDSKNLRYAPIAFNALAGSGLFGKSPAPDKYNPTLIQQQGTLSAPQVDEQTMRANIDSAYQNQIRGMADASGGSGAALRAGLTGVGADYMSAVGQGFLGANTANNQAKMQADQYNLGMAGNIAAQNAQMQNQAGMYNTQMSNQNKALNYDNRMSYLGKAAEGVGDIGYEERIREILPRIFGYNDLGKHSPNAKSCGGKLKMLKHRK